MDFSFFGLARRPFPATPDVDLYFPSATHDAAVAALTDAYESGDGFALIDGEPGTGKTLAVLRFLANLSAGAPTVFVPAPRFARPADLFQAILFDLGIAYQGLSEQELRLAVADRLLSGLTDGNAPVVIVLDEAQHLTADILEEVRLLGNLESRSAKAAFVVLSGLPAVRTHLGKPDSAGLAQRVAVRCRVEPLTAEESALFVAHQIEACGGNPEAVATDEATALLTTHCHGVPRLLNQAALSAFALAAAAGEKTVDAEPVLEALVRLGLAAEVVDEPATLPHPVQEATVKPKGRKRKSA